MEIGGKWVVILGMCLVFGAGNEAHATLRQLTHLTDPNFHQFMSPTLSAKGDYLYFIASAFKLWQTGSESSQIFRQHILTGEIQQVSNFTAGERLDNIVISGDGSKIAIAMYNALWAINPDGSGLIELRPADPPVLNVFLKNFLLLSVYQQ